MRDILIDVNLKPHLIRRWRQIHEIPYTPYKEYTSNRELISVLWSVREDKWMYNVDCGVSGNYITIVDNVGNTLDKNQLALLFMDAIASDMRSADSFKNPHEFGELYNVCLQWLKNNAVKLN